jgi:hypothetical protein
VALYGLAQPDHKENFLAELVGMGSQENLPLIMGGDFNIIFMAPIREKQR